MVQTSIVMCLLRYCIVRDRDVAGAHHPDAGSGTQALRPERR